MNRSARVVGVLSITLALAAAVIVFNIRRYPNRVQGQPTIGPATVHQAVAHDMSAPLALLTSGEQDGGGNHSALGGLRADGNGPERRLHDLVRRRLRQERRDELFEQDRSVPIAGVRALEDWIERAAMAEMDAFERYVLLSDQKLLLVRPRSTHKTQRPED